MSDVVKKSVVLPPEVIGRIAQAKRLEDGIEQELQKQKRNLQDLLAITVLMAGAPTNAEVQLDTGLLVWQESPPSPPAE